MTDNTAKLIAIKPQRPADGVYLGPAHVMRSGNREVRVRLETGDVVDAQLAMALPYISVEGDVVLVTGRDERHYVLGVLSGSGQTALHFRGDVDLRSIGGNVTIHADKGVKLQGDEVAIEARQMSVVADALVQRFNSVMQRVRGLFSSRVKQAQLIVDETAFSKAKSATLLTEESVVINGEQIHLG